jgi:hypothetical protein
VKLRNAALVAPSAALVSPGISLVAQARAMPATRSSGITVPTANRNESLTS